MKIDNDIKAKLKTHFRTHVMVTCLSCMFKLFVFVNAQILFTVEVKGGLLPLGHPYFLR